MSEAVLENKKTASANKKDRLFLWDLGTAAGFIGGLILLSAGLLMSAISYFDHINFHGLEAAALAASFVVLMLGAHFLDLAEKETKRRKREKLNL